jgi:plasmid stabilization system protein ParE
MTRLVVTVDAEADTRDILAYLERNAGPLVAAKYGRRFRLTLQRVVDMPGMGSPRPALGLIYDYVAGGDTLTLLRILHGAAISRAICCSVELAVPLFLGAWQRGESRLKSC